MRFCGVIGRNNSAPCLGCSHRNFVEAIGAVFQIFVILRTITGAGTGYRWFAGCQIAGTPADPPQKTATKMCHQVQGIMRLPHARLQAPRMRVRASWDRKPPLLRSDHVCCSQPQLRASDRKKVGSDSPDGGRKCCRGPVKAWRPFPLTPANSRR